MFPVDAVAVLAHAVVAVAPLRLHAATGELTLPRSKSGQNFTTHHHCRITGPTRQHAAWTHEKTL